MNKKLNYVWLLVLLGVLLGFPSFLYICKNGTLIESVNENTYFIGHTDLKTSILGAFIYGMIVVLSFIVYLKTIKHADEFKSTKSLMLAVLIVGFAFCISMPNTSSDVFYYMGTGRVVQEYNMNPYSVTPAEVLKTNSDDTILSATGAWSNEKVVYGPLWISFCALLNKFSFGSLLCLLNVFKIANLIAYVGSTYLIYKLTGKKKMALLFAFNPLILLEALTNVHNDIYLVLLCLCAIFFVRLSDKEKNKFKKLFLIILSMAFLLFASLIKYIALLFVPFLILYIVKDRKLFTKIMSLLLIGWAFGMAFILMYVPWFGNITEIFRGIFAQQGKAMNSIYLLFYQLSKGNMQLISIIYSAMIAVLFFNFIINLLLRIRDKFSFRMDMQDLGFLLAFLMFGVLTTLTAWYMLWMFIFVYWFRSSNVKNVLYLSLGFELSNIIFVLMHDMNPINECIVIPVLILSLIIGRLINGKKK